MNTGVTRLLATSVVRGSQQGESHGGVYVVDLEQQSVRQALDWNRMDIDWQGRGWDRGLRGITIVDGTVWIAASDELFAYTPDFRLLGSWRNRWLRHCHEIDHFDGNIFLTSTGFDSILAFSISERRFHWALQAEAENSRLKGRVYDPEGDEGPLPLNKLHLNSIACRKGGMYLAGLNSGGMLHFNGDRLRMAVSLPDGTHNAQPFRHGVLFNDTRNDRLRYNARGEANEDRSLPVPRYDPAELSHCELDASGIARQAFARGLAVLSERVVAGGSSPSTITLYDLKDSRRLLSVRLSTDIRNAIHGLAAWPFD